MPSAEKVAASWRVASPAAVHPELDEDGRDHGGSAQGTLDELLAGIYLYLPTFPSTLRLLDYGGGPGRVARLAASRFSQTIVADTNPAYLSLAADHPGVETLLVSPIPSSLPEADVILCVNLFLHLPPEAGRDLLRLFARSLPAWGLLALQLPLYDFAVRPATWTSVGTWTLDQFEAAADEAGLVVLEAHPNPGRYQLGKQPGPNHGRLHFLKPRAVF